MRCKILICSYCSSPEKPADNFEGLRSEAVARCSKDAASTLSASTTEETIGDLNSWIALAVHRRPFIDNVPVSGLAELNDDADLAVEEKLLEGLKRS
jgi:hypothetical protein